MPATPRFRLLLLASSLLALAAPTLRAAPATLDERIILVPDAGTDKEDRDITQWQARIRIAAGSEQAVAGAYERLGWAYMAKARRTLDAGYYKLAEKTADVMDARFGSTSEALLLRGSVDHNLHRFAEALSDSLAAIR